MAGINDEKKYQKKYTIGPNKARMLIWAIDMVKVGGRHMVWRHHGGGN